MRELALVSIRNVDKTDRLYPEEVDGWYVNANGTTAYPEDFMLLIHRPTGEPKSDEVHQTSDSTESQLQPETPLTLIRVEACNSDSILDELFKECDELSRCIDKIERAGVKLLKSDNRRRIELNEMSKLLSGDGVEQSKTIQFYAVFQITVKGSGVEAEAFANLEGVLRLDKIDMAIDEAVLLP